MKRRLYRNKKAVSTVIATILMIMVVMVGMSILFGSLIVYSDIFHKGSGSSVLENITVEDVDFSAHLVKLSIFNTGKVDLEISNIYINDQLATILGLDPQQKTVPISEGTHYDGLLVEPPTGLTFNSGVPYDFKIVTLRGSGFEGTYVW